MYKVDSVSAQTKKLKKYIYTKLFFISSPFAHWSSMVCLVLGVAYHIKNPLYPLLFNILLLIY
jgi:hypothetical protein